MLAVPMFVFRLRARFPYGALEVAFGVFVLWDAAGKGRGDFGSDFSNDFSKFQLTVVLGQTLAAIYVIIRGFDNCYHGWPKVTSMADRWVAGHVDCTYAGGRWATAAHLEVRGPRIEVDRRVIVGRW